MEENNKITKIIVNRDDELTDIVSGILDAKSDKIIVTFAEESDLLISPINLSAILETATDTQKSIIAQIIKNPTGVRNCNLAGLITTDSPNNPTEEMWEDAQKVLSSVALPPVNKVEEIKPQEEEILPKRSDFEDRINSAILKSKDIRLQTPEKTKTDDDLIISVNEDLPSEEVLPSTPTLANTDFSKVRIPQNSFERVSKVPSSSKTKMFFSNIFKKKEKLQNIGVQNVPSSGFTHKLKRLLPVAIISIVLITVLVGFIYYNTVPLVKVSVFVESKDVNIEKVFTGDENIKETDFTNLKIPVKVESVDKSRSSNVTATGKAFKGEKAKGSVIVIYKCTSAKDPINLPKGQLLTTGGKSFTLDTDTSIACNVFNTVVTVQAIEIGEEYNIATSQYFTLQGFSSDDVWGTSTGAFTGGTKQEYTVLSLTDVNTAVEELKTTAIQEAEQELKDKSAQWVIIDGSIQSDVVKDSIKTDVPVGSQATQANISMSVKSTARYFFKDGFDSGISVLLTQEAQSKNLFENNNNMELVLGEEITKEVSVVQDNKNGVLIKLVAKGSVRPKVVKEDIVKKLQQMSWVDGTKYLDDMKYSDQATKYEFTPVNFPKSLYHFPKRQGSILVQIVNV